MPSKATTTSGIAANVLTTELSQRLANTADDVRNSQAAKRHAKGFNTARENLQKLCAGSVFREYGQLAVAAQRQRRDYKELQTETAADGVITGIAPLNQDDIELSAASINSHDTVLVVNDYSVLAGTQGYFHHLKLDRLWLALSMKNRGQCAI